jgi:hypothetical protein
MDGSTYCKSHKFHWRRIGEAIFWVLIFRWWSQRKSPACETFAFLHNARRRRSFVMARTKVCARRPIRTQRLKGLFIFSKGKYDKQRGPRNTTAHVSVQTRNAGPQKWNNGAETRAICWCQVEVPRRGRPLSRRLNPQSALWGPRGGRARADLCAPTPAGASFFSASHIHPTEPETWELRERDTSRCSFRVSVCVCALCYINLIVTRWETLVRKKACARCLSPRHINAQIIFFSRIMCIYVYDSPTEKLCDVFSVSLGLWPLFYPARATERLWSCESVSYF